MTFAQNTTPGDGLLIESRPADDPDLNRLLQEAFAELVRRTAAQGHSPVADRAQFLLARLGDRPAGCIALQPAATDVGEIKRMYVLPAFRGRGVGRALVDRTEQLAAHLGYRTIRLATSLLHPEAIALYEACKYVLTEPYGKYVGDPLVRCYAKKIG